MCENVLLQVHTYSVKRLPLTFVDSHRVGKPEGELCSFEWNREIPTVRALGTKLVLLVVIQGKSISPGLLR